MYLTITVNGNTTLPEYPYVQAGESTTQGERVTVTLTDVGGIGDGATVLGVTAIDPDPKALALLVAGYYPKRGAK